MRLSSQRFSRRAAREKTAHEVFIDVHREKFSDAREKKSHANH
jgi:hypothetical protein